MEDPCLRVRSGMIQYADGKQKAGVIADPEVTDYFSEFADRQIAQPEETDRVEFIMHEDADVGLHAMKVVVLSDEYDITIHWPRHQESRDVAEWFALDDGFPCSANCASSPAA